MMATAIEVTMTLTKETKGTFRYDNNEPGAAIRTLYITKEAMPQGPNEVTITIN